MGLWDILVPAEPGVLHNTIANPSFEYDTGEITKVFGRYSPSKQNLTYWNAVSGATISASTDWASRGQTSLKISKGISSGAGVEYYPRGTSFAAPTLTAGQAAGGNLAAGVKITFAVMGLTDVGLSLANGITDAQVQPESSLALPLHSWLYPSLDSRRGHGTLTYASSVTIVGGSKVATLSIKDNSASRNNYPRGWAVWYSTDAGAPTNGTYMLAGVFANTTAFMDGTITIRQTSLNVSGVDTNFVSGDVGRVLYSSDGTTIGTINSVSSPTSVILTGFPTFSGDNIEFRTETTISLSNAITGSIPTVQGVDTISINPIDTFTVNRTINNFVAGDVGKHIYILSNSNQYLFVGTIQSISSKEATLLSRAQFAPVQSLFYLSTETNPQSFPENNQGAIRMFTRSLSRYTPPEINLNCSAPYWGITNSSFGGFTHKHHLYLDWYLSADNTLNPNATYTNTGADWSVYLYNNYTSTETLLGKLDGTGTTAAAKRMGLRTKFLINRPADHTEDMRLRIKYTGASASDAVLYIDGVQFVDVGMVWRAYDWYSANIGAYSTPPQFEDWNWDDVEFSYIDGDTPGGMWSDTMPTQSGTYNAAFPYFLNNGVWMRDFYEYETPSASTSAGGYAGPRFRLNYQWRNSASPIYGISVPGLSQSSMQTQTFTTGFWAPLSTDNINVVVEPSISGVGMPEIATTAIEYGIVDGGYVQRQVARMRNLQFTITISANSWVGLHANRRSLINLLKFDQLAQQGERLIRYRGADIPVFTSVTYQSGLEYSGTQGVSFTEALALRFLSTDPYFYTETSLSTDVSPHEYNKLDFSHVMFKMGNDAAWMPLSHKYYKVNNSDQVSTNNDVAGASYFYDSNDVLITPEALGWIQSPSGAISALVVGGTFTKPVPYLSVFYVSGYNGNLTDTYNTVTSESRNEALTTNVGSNAWSIVGANQLTISDINKYLFSDTNLLIGRIQSITSSVGPTTGTFYENALVSNTTGWTLVSVSSSALQTLPNNVHLHNVLLADNEVSDVYQESANSVLVAGYVETISDNITSQPNTSGTGYIASQMTNPSATYKNRVFRIFMNDNGRIEMQAVDDVFTKSTTGSQVTYTSSLRTKMNYKIQNDFTSSAINAITKTPTNYVIVASWGDNTSSQLVYDEVLGATMPGAIDRSNSAFANEDVSSGVLGIDPVGNAFFVGSRQTVIGKGTIITDLINEGNKFLVEGRNTSFTNFYYQGRNLYTLDGLFIGKVYYVESSTKLYVSEPIQIYLYLAQFEISIDLGKVVSDKKSLRSSLYAAAATNAYTWGSGNSNQFAYGYFNNPSLIGQISVVEGSRSVASTVNILENYGLSVEVAARITASNASVDATITGMVPPQSIVGNYILRKDTREYIGQVKEVTGLTTVAATYGIIFSRKPNMNVPSITSVEFVIRSSRQIVDETGYAAIAGNITRTDSPNVATTEYNARKTYSNAIIPEFIVPSFTTSGTVSTFKTPYIFGDTANLTMYMQTNSDPTNKILRRGVFEIYPNANTSSNLQTYRTQGFGVIVNGFTTPQLLQAPGTITTVAGSRNFTMSIANTFAASDVGRSLYVNVGGTITFLGIIRTITSTSPTNQGTLINIPSAYVTAGIAYQVFYTYWYFPYQFRLASADVHKKYFSTQNEGMTTSQVVARTTATAFNVSFCNASVTSTTRRPLLFAYINAMWIYAGQITATNASQITVGGGVEILIPDQAPLAIVPAFTVWSSSARAYSVGQELFSLVDNSRTNYMGTIQKVILATDNYAILAIMPYSYSQSGVPTQNTGSFANQYSMVWVNAKQYRGSQVSNFFANAIGVVDNQSSDFTNLTLENFPVSVPSDGLNVVYPGVLRGSFSTTSGSTAVTGLNTAFVATATVSNPMNTGRFLFTVDGRPISSAAGSSITNTPAITSTSLTLGAAATITNVHTNYRIGSTRTVFDGGAMTTLTTSDIVSFNSTSFSVTVSSITTTTVTNDTIVISSGSGSIRDNWIGRAIYNGSVGVLIGVIKSISTSVIILETSAENVGATPITMLVASVPLKWTFNPGDIIRRMVTINNIGQAGAIVGQVLQINIAQNNVVLTTSSNFAVTNEPFAVEKGKGVGRGQGVITNIGVSQITGTGTFFSQLPLNSDIGAVADIYANVGGTSGSYTIVAQATSAASDYVLNVQFGQFTATDVAYEWYYVIRNQGYGGSTQNDVRDRMTAINFYTNTLDAYLVASSLGIGTITGVFSRIALSTPLNPITPGAGTISVATGVSAAVTGVLTTFQDGNVGMGLWALVGNVYVFVGVVQSRSTTTAMVLTNNVYGLAIPAGSTYYLQYEGAFTSQFGLLRGANTITASQTVPTQFTYQVCPGDIIQCYSGTFPPGVQTWFRVVQVLSDSELIVVSKDGNFIPNSSVSFSSVSYRYTIIKQTTESVVFDSGITGYTNPDWQPLGYTNGNVLSLNVTPNGDVYAGGSFTQWVKKSSSLPTGDGNTSVSYVNRIAKVVAAINSQGYLDDAYGAPIAGNSYVRNGFYNGEVYDIVDTSNINPVNGYIGSSDTLMVGGSFTATADDVTVPSGLAVLPSSSISNTMRQITNADLSTLNSGLVESVTVKRIASTNRLRQYNGLISTNTLDGINGTNTAILYNGTVTINHTTQYHALRVRGNASTYPVITIAYSTQSNLSNNATKSLYSLIQTTTGAKIEFANNELLVYNGEIITIDLRLGRRSIVSNLRGNLANALNPNSNFVDFILLGANNSAGLSTQSYDDYRINVVGVHADAGLSVTFTYVPKFWSFDANNLFFGSTKAGL
jgi:hypothetical protein